MTDLNREYRHAAKMDTLDNGRKIRKTKGTDDLVLRVLDAARKYSAAERMRTEVSPSDWSVLVPVLIAIVLSS